MTRALHPLLLLVGLAAQGCIIYEERFVTTDCEGDCTSTWTWTDPTDPTEPTDPTTEPTDPGPVVTADLELTVRTGAAGESLLSSLVAVGDFDLATVDRVVFERSVEILDTLPREDEVVLLLAIDADAEPGLVDVFVETADGEGYVLEQPFEITAEGGTPTDPTTEPGDTGTTTTDTGCN